ncbi:t-SNARE domain-containing protein 1-like [Acropora muricata]|uniref:t-SNARE domain-containing protein 1-like n=1 Tax=Acropora muricata TaxID=159855 RepID=UPI0034E4A40F
MAESVESGDEREVTDESKARKRKPNFSMNEIAVITENVKNHLAVIQSKLTNNITNRKKNEVWQEITDAVNAVGTAGRTVVEVKDKWKNLHSTAKKEFATFKRETKKTGGGPAPKPPSASSGKIIEVFEDTPAFIGLNGFETGT